ncbi:TPA: DUF551 domain-containing protein [Escherichia coli]|uniref:DUF551 domain-containing protein n=1 Tax=Enterobacteriaceae TaxID=543 RepID=UPI00073C1107|nr:MULTISPECIES: DUF551 domain-containing protein [Enterobacteriaceae]HDM0070945.1 DUF551 domain-containing protein [Escherichia coli O8:H9]EFB7453682.1 DUF551 domain-containing protein [Escherichia coli]EFH2613310.1 DUF551 domain-containing protein [Escherichia coli]EGI1186067.1 DUF551 domain-containing protein [Escherichia coli]EGI6803626.1 DUF551 domain-containing protein [Escherichia coli]
MSTIPKERLEQLASGNAWYCVQDDEAAELARIALASLEAEPYGYVHKAAYEKTGSCGLSNDREAYRYSSTHVAVYTAPPAPVSVPAAMEMDDDFDSAFEHGKAVGWNACRAAMLQSQGNCIKDGWISCSDRMPEDTKMLLAFSQGEIVAAYWNWVVNPIDYKKYRAFTYLSGNILDDVTHWMPLPEPPL